MTKQHSVESAGRFQDTIGMLVRSLADRSFDPRLHIAVAREYLQLAEEELEDREDAPED